MTRRRALWWTLALGASLAIPLSSPWLGVLRDEIEGRLGGRYVAVLAIGLATVGVVAVAACAVALASIRTGRSWRYGLLAAAAGLAVLQPLLWGQGIRRVDLVERVHLVEYAAVSFLYLLALRDRIRDAALPVAAILAATLVGVADEAIQWLSPARVGDVRDVTLNAWAGAIGALFALAVVPPSGFRLRPEAASVRTVRRLALVVLLAGAALFGRIGVGTVIQDPQAGAFVSHFAPADLLTVRDRRAVRWASAPPEPPHPLGREDPFLSEAGFHKAARDHAATHGWPRRAWLENRILERWYTPYLRFRSFENGAPNRWSAEMRAAMREEARRHGGLRPGTYRSPVLVRSLRPVPRSLLWAGVLLAAAGLWSGGRRLERSLAAAGSGEAPSPRGKAPVLVRSGEPFAGREERE